MDARSKQSRRQALRDAADAGRRPARPGARDHLHSSCGLRLQVRDFAAPAAVRRPDLRFTVDTPADLAYMRRVLGRRAPTRDRAIPLRHLITAADDLSRGEEVA